MAEYRNYKTIITEAELLASPPTVVVDWLKERSAKVDGLFGHEGDDALEAALLDRDDPLITLALARFGLSEGVLQSLFARTDAPTIRLAVLSNTAYPRSTWRFPSGLVGTRDDWDWAAALTDDELVALFENEELPDEFVRGFLEREGCWEIFDDRKRQLAIIAMSKKLSERGEYDGHWDGYSDYSHSKVFDVAWRLASDVPVTLQWAHALNHLYHRLRPYSFSIKNPLELAKRWYPAADDTEQLEQERKSNERGYFGPYQKVRSALGRLAADGANDSSIRSDLLNSDDVALRCAAYRTLSMKPEEILAAYERDTALALDDLLENTNIWRREETREALSEVCWQSSKDDKESSLMYPEIFSRKRNRLEVDKPAWFADASETASAVEDPIRTLTERLNKVEKLFVNQRNLLWVVIALLGILMVVR